MWIVLATKMRPFNLCRTNTITTTPRYFNISIHDLQKKWPPNKAEVWKESHLEDKRVFFQLNEHFLRIFGGLCRMTSIAICINLQVRMFDGVVIHRSCYETVCLITSLHKFLPSIPLQGGKDEDFPITTPRTDNRSALKFNTASYGV